MSADLRILFIASNRIGDAILSTGILARLLTEYPGAKVTVAAGPAALPVFGGVPGLERAIPLRKRRFGLHWLGLWWKTFGRSWRVVVDMRRSAIAWMLFADRRLTPAKGDRTRHRVVQAADMLGIAGAPPAPKIWLRTPHRDAARSLIPLTGPVLALGPTANWGGKMWPGERFAELALRLTAPDGPLPGARIAVFGGPDERLQANPVLSAIPRDRRIDLVGKVDVLTAGACLERCAMYIGNDSGLMHLSAAIGIPTLGLFGPSDERAYAPWGSRTAFVRTPESMDEIMAKPGYDYRSNDTHMGSLTVDSVEKAALALWAGSGKGEAA